jgi:hypothetical protein
MAFPSDLTRLQTSPSSSISPPSAPTETTSSLILGSQRTEDGAGSNKLESASISSSLKIKKKFSEIDFRGAVAELGPKRTAVEDFYIQLNEPHRIFWCPGDVIKGMR